MRASGFLEAEGDIAQVGLAQPIRREPSQYASFGRPRSPFVQRAALAGDDNDQLAAACLRMAQEAAQRMMRLGLVSCHGGRSHRRSRRAHVRACASAAVRSARTAARTASPIGLLAPQPQSPRKQGAGAATTGFEGVGRTAPRRGAALRATSVQSAISSSLRRLRRGGAAEGEACSRSWSGLAP